MNIEFRQADRQDEEELFNLAVSLATSYELCFFFVWTSFKNQILIFSMIFSSFLIVLFRNFTLLL